MLCHYYFAQELSFSRDTNKVGRNEIVGFNRIKAMMSVCDSIERKFITKLYRSKIR